MSLAAAVRAGLAELEPLDVRDRAVADLAMIYATQIDNALSWETNTDRGRPEGWRDVQRDPVAELGPKLLAALTALGMTPAARKGITGAAPVEKPRSPLDELREARAKRATS
jgi:hypothetical protein